MVTLGILFLLVEQVQLALKVLQVFKAQQVQLALKVLQVFRAQQVQLALKVLQVFKAQQVQLALKVQLALLVIMLHTSTAQQEQS
jgi:hypothetical protein